MVSNLGSGRLCYLSFGLLMELFGKEWSMYLLDPGLWEITFAIWLIIYGGQGVKTTTR